MRKDCVRKHSEASGRTFLIKKVPTEILTSMLSATSHHQIIGSLRVRNVDDLLVYVTALGFYASII